MLRVVLFSNPHTRTCPNVRIDFIALVLRCREVPSLVVPKETGYPAYILLFPEFSLLLQHIIV